MSLSDKIAPELPYLRRFARALSGSQESGDAYVVAMLEALVADSSLFPKNMETKAAVFRTFLKVWNSVKVNGMDDVGDGIAAKNLPERRLELISSKPRQAFLLVAVEGLSTANAAIALDVSPNEVKALIDRAGNEIAEQVATSVLIIEDEPLIALDLSDLVTSIGHTVCSIASTHKAAIAAFDKHKPGLVLADVQLADGSSGLEAVNEILKSFEVPVIFITAYPERLLTGVRPEPTFLINKPFQPETVKAIISQALFFEQKSKQSSLRTAS
jgi:CheY-like chemotaxis protein/DNA-directed RNA polymerase specialized sigma24 family protein